MHVYVYIYLGGAGRNKKTPCEALRQRCMLLCIFAGIANCFRKSYEDSASDCAPELRQHWLLEKTVIATLEDYSKQALRERFLPDWVRPRLY